MRDWDWPSWLASNFRLKVEFQLHSCHWLKLCTFINIECYGTSVAKWLAHLPFTSEAAGSSLSDNFLLMRLEPSPHVKRVKVQRSAESRGFSPGTPVSSHRES
jgi:hypothetical protein